MLNCSQILLVNYIFYSIARDLFEVCKSSRGLACHIKSIHSTQETLASYYFGLNDFSQLIVNSVEKLKCKEYLPDEVLGEFNCITFNDSMSQHILMQLLRKLLWNLFAVVMGSSFILPLIVVYVEILMLSLAKVCVDNLVFLGQSIRLRTRNSKRQNE